MRKSRYDASGQYDLIHLKKKKYCMLGRGDEEVGCPSWSKGLVLSTNVLRTRGFKPRSYQKFFF